MGKDEVSERYKEMCTRAGGGRASRYKLLKSREAMSMGDASVQGGDINGDNQDIEGKGMGEGAEDSGNG